MDYAVVLRRMMYLSTAGYIVGILFKMQFRLAILFPIPVLVKFLYD